MVSGTGTKLIVGEKIGHGDYNIGDVGESIEDLG